ncbi:MurR/RpiR family transcriptional regulator [Aeromonas cavernicola]|nr:SIS domain-containing protein [Aeromonas cavernicola]
MLDIKIALLNKVEKRIFDTLRAQLAADPQRYITITEAAQLCQVSSSKISKTVAKLGFASYKKCIAFYQGGQLSTPVSVRQPSELDRVAQFIDSFDATIAEKTYQMMARHSKIIFYGLGPSFICAQYLVYKLQCLTSIPIFATSDAVTFKHYLDQESLLIILTTTGMFADFDQVINDAKQSGSSILMVLEEYNKQIYPEVSHKVFLTKQHQPNYLQPFEKTRTLFFIFFEEVLRHFYHHKH